MMESANFSTPDSGVLQGIAQRVREELCRMQVNSDTSRRCEVVKAGSIHTGVLDIVRFEGYGEQRGYRRTLDISRDSADCYIFSVPIAARFATSQSGAEVTTLPGQFSFMSTARPFQVEIHPGSSRAFSSLHIRIPGTAFRRYIPSADELCQVNFSIRAGMGRIMQSMLGIALRQGGLLDDARDVERLGDMVLQSIASTVDSENRRSSYPARSAKHVGFARVRADAERYMQTHLSNPRLSPQRVAEHCGVSVRYLYNAFGRIGYTIGGNIRELRLQACRKALRNPGLRHRTITEIAGQWGFDNPAHFSRTYKKRFGCSPKQDRPARAVNRP